MKKLILLFTSLAMLSVACKNNTPKTEESTTDTIAETQEQPQEAPTESSFDDSTVRKVKISTQYGDMIVKLYNETPLHRDNFIELVKKGYYNDLIFHRVIQGFMIQGGDPETKNAKAGTVYGSGGPGYTIPAEIKTSLFHKKGALAAARTENPAKESSGSQFYIVQGNVYTPADLQQLSQRSNVYYTPEQTNIYTTVGGTPQLDMQYTVFGEVIEGLEVIDKIAAQPVDQRMGNRPYADVKFKMSMVEGATK